MVYNTFIRQEMPDKANDENTTFVIEGNCAAFIQDLGQASLAYASKDALDSRSSRE